MSISSPIYCQDCGRANGAAANKCLWCGVPLQQGASPGKFEATQVEIDYLGGIERLNDPMAVKLVINTSGIEVSEIIPGSRKITIPAAALIETRVVDATTIVEGKRVRSKWWWVALGPLALMVRGKKLPDTIKHDYILTIKFRSGQEVSNAVFHREDRLGLSLVNGLARIITSLIQRDRGEITGYRGKGTGG